MYTNLLYSLSAMSDIGSSVSRERLQGEDTQVVKKTWGKKSNPVSEVESESKSESKMPVHEKGGLWAVEK